MTTSAKFDHRFNSSETALIHKAKEFAQQYLRAADTLDTESHRELLQRACNYGFSGIEVPANLGGAQASYSTRMRVCEELARKHAGFAFSVINHHNIVSRVALSGTSDLQQQLIKPMLEGKLIGCTAMTEPQSGSDFSHMVTTAKKTTTGWKINGAKAWITNASLADVFLVYAQTDANLGAKGVAGFLVRSENTGFERLSSHRSIGIPGMGVGQFVMHDCWLPEERLLYPPGNGFAAAMRGVNQARVHVAAINVAMTQAALDHALRYTNERQAFAQPIIKFQGLSWSLANVATQLQAMRLLTYDAAAAIDANDDAQAVAAMAKKYANDHALQAIADCMQAMGANGLNDDFKLNRLLLWAKAFCYTDGTPEMMNERIVRCLQKSNGYR